MAVPTIYHKLLNHYEQSSVQEQQLCSAALSKFRLMVSGSAALPVSLLEKWKTISGHILLERYGMTETGMMISNPYRGHRRAGTVGLPLPRVEIRLVDENGKPVTCEGMAGEIQVKSPSLFKEYLHRQEDTVASFSSDGWFCTGDMALCESDGYYRILGRISSDIIKSGGYKLSALEIEELLRQYPGVIDCAVLGLPDEQWGELVAAALVYTIENKSIESDLNDWLRQQLPTYKLPRRWLFLSELPRNAMGKVSKKELKIIFEQQL